MLGAALKETTGLFERRFLLNALLPALVLVGLCGAVAVGSTAGPKAGLAAWNRQDTLLKALYSVAFVAAVVLVATWLSGLNALLLRWYEGDWSRRPWRLLAGVGRRWHSRVHARLRPERLPDYQRLYSGYPPDLAEVMPTRLGNILKNAVLHPEGRYGIDAALVWPRLYPLLPADHRATLAAIRADLEFFLTVSFLAGLFSTASGLFLLVTGAPAGLFLLCYAGGAAVALIGYACALGPARLYGEQVKVTFDVYRGDLLKQLGHESGSEDEEWVLWEALAQQWYRGAPIAATLRAAAEPADDVDGVGDVGDVGSSEGPGGRRAWRVVRLPLSAWFVILTLVVGAVGASLLV
ncbi:hypothetical protein [Nonomuraea sp. NPDC049607]|uniref:hypothetical protein n=1 Tax=Nonomuraea sp. NPDC049607 TaxID=3154732 RepID=UPI003432B438